MERTRFSVVNSCRGFQPPSQASCKARRRWGRRLANWPMGCNSANVVVYRLLDCGSGSASPCSIGRYITFECHLSEPFPLTSFPPAFSSPVGPKAPGDTALLDGKFLFELRQALNVRSGHDPADRVKRSPFRFRKFF